MKATIKTLLKKKQSKEPITWLTCYDYSMASALNSTELDMILVGDSGGMTVLGYSDTVPVTMDEMLLLAKAVRRGATGKFLVGDMPKGSYEVSDDVAVQNAMRFVKEAGCDAVKLEGSGVMIDRIKAICASGIPTIGHLGLTPQTSGQFGGYRVVGKNQSEATKLLEDAKKIEEAGAFCLLIEATPGNLAQTISSDLNMVCMGIGAGSGTDGQLLILHDLLGLYPNFRPKFAKCYVPQVLESFYRSLQQESDLVAFGRSSRKDGFNRLIELSVDSFVTEVKDGTFPSSTYTY
jgi:3-methyl-2-oxobutanoate hydroxymethyltransferase